MTALLWVTGASGTGKTETVREVSRRALARVRCYHFDSIGVPEYEVMLRDFGSPEAWQAATTRAWLQRIETEGPAVALIEGQTRPTFVLEALRGSRIEPARVVLFDCSSAVRGMRLLGPRQQPELSNPTMEAWAAYLRDQAGALGLRVIDTGGLSLEEAADSLQNELESLG